ncbi:DUF3630 family protein [Aestuariibacter sp. AA17]|uniref:DUF3630 family protein n=1 Tax=Fluctibacter corallii TaxID=2984329 RepID=A0ABT3AC13_9ALTE|nr:DUF3630 family protein [Aestuariibacter sp. AA17]MCV2886215.1 DUF3630 family protein [Aestuariibacter sp. AA17]
MQQLTPIWRVQDQQLVCHLSVFPTEEQVQQWRECLRKTDTIRIIEHVEGADRQLIRLAFQNAEFLLFLEYTCEACWIEASHVEGEKYLPDLRTELQKVC